MPRLSKRVQAFLADYSARYSQFQSLAEDLRSYIAEAIHDLPVAIHLTTARAKTPDSLRGKCRRKKYDNPKQQVTDLLAVRVITFFKDDVDAVADRLRNVLDVSAKKSKDTRRVLDENEFGYRSVHLVARMRVSVASNSTIGRRWFEIQIRSILDHAWSEIEHEIIYKSGVRYPEVVRRKFKALAASLEVLEDSFAALTTERDKLIDRYKLQYEGGGGLDQPFDVARLEAFLELRRPDGRGWRQAEREGSPFPHGSAGVSVEALQAAGASTARRLSAILASSAFRKSITRFASVEGIAPETASHLAITVLAVAAVRPNLLREQFRDIAFSPAVSAAVGL